MSQEKKQKILKEPERVYPCDLSVEEVAERLGIRSYASTYLGY